MTTCALSYMSTRVRACLRAGACMRACQWSRLAEEYVRLRRFSARVTPAFSSFGSLPFFLRTLHSPFSPFSVSRDRCSSTLLVTSSRVHRTRFETLCLLASRNFTRPKKLGVFSCTVVGRTSQRNKEEENDDRVEDVLPGQPCPAVQRRISCVLSAANKVIIIAAGKAPGGKRATSSSSVYTFPGVSKCVCECVGCRVQSCIHTRLCTCTHYVLHAALARLLATIRARLPRAVWEFLSR